MNNHNLQHTIALLTRTPGAVDALLRDLPETWTHRNEGEGTMSAFDVVGHLTFAPFDRWGHVRESQGKSLSQLLDEFTIVRSRSLDELHALNLQPDDLERLGRHPAFGAVTLSQLLATWAAHDLTHLHQISRIMAHQYRGAVGPYSAYLGVLQCGGHSAP
jgi:hypothetical protein